MMDNPGKVAKKTAPAFSRTTKSAQYDAGGKQVVCLHCGAAMFTEGAVSASAVGMVGLFHVLDMASTLVCTHCGYVQWFLKRPQRR
ncbi:MAG: hypothetical protein MUC88_25185 [Planctomycetes bacterium]|jgi:predicted nucleic-acid-binding Zn-ribbon protein|nr:hypothetical protein [Planctomycetota bacterium]